MVDSTDHHFSERLGPGSPTWDAHSAFHVARYLFAADHVRGKRVLDAGTGTGYGARILKAAGAAEVQGIDIDPASIAQAQEKFATEGLQYLVNDCEKLANVQGPFDIICNFENIEHLNQPEAFLANAARLLKDDGLLLCSTPDRATSEWEGKSRAIRTTLSSGIGMSSRRSWPALLPRWRSGFRSNTCRWFSAARRRIT